MQKSRILIAALAGALLLPMVACKKGANDPMSLSSRTGRLVGTWELIESESRSSSYNEATNSYSNSYATFDGTTYTDTDTLIIGASTTAFPSSTATHTSELTFEKDGNFSMDETWDGNADAAEGYWYWGGKSKAGELKKKETVMYVITETNDGSIDNFGGTAIPVDGSMQLDRLSGKEMWAIVNVSNTYSNLDTYTYWSVMKFAKQ